MNSTTVNGGDGRVRFQCDPTTGKIMFWQGENVATFDLPPVPGRDAPAAPVSAPEAEAETSYARAFLLEFRQQRGDFLQPLRIESNDLVLEVAVKTLSDAEVVEAGVLMASRGYTLMALTDVSAQTVFFAALLTVGVMCRETPHRRYFARLSEAEALLTEPGLAEFAATLKGALVRQNPFVKKNLRPPLETRVEIPRRGQAAS